MRSLRTLLPATVLLLATSCASSNDEADGPDGGEEPIRSGHELVEGGRRVARINEDNTWMRTWGMIKRDLDSQQERTVGAVLRRGKQLIVQAVRIGDSLPPPAEPAAEVLLVIEGEGTLEASGEHHSLEPGSIAVLPPASRGTVTSTGGNLYAIILRSTSTATSGQPVVLSGEEAFPRALLDSVGGTVAHAIGRVPGAISVRSASVGGVVQRHVHLEHEEFMFLISGWGELGLGAEGSARHFIRHPLRDHAMVLIPAHAPHSYVNAADKTLLLSVHAPARANDGDTYSVDDRGAVGETIGFSKRPKKKR